jgi:hypothetical protein
VPTSVAGQSPLKAHTTVKTTIGKLPGAAARLAVINAHPPAILRPAAGIGGTYLCDVCSPGLSRVAWPCPPYRAAAGADITGLGG